MSSSVIPAGHDSASTPQFECEITITATHIENPATPNVTQEAQDSRHVEPAPWWTATLTTFAGLLLGVFVTLSSVGAGAIGMTALVLLYPRTPIARLVGSDIAHAVPLTLIAGVGHWLLGSVDWVLLGSLVMGSLPGIFFGSHLSARVPDKVLRPVLATILVIVGVRMLRA
jgi:uncharacterized protein